MKLLMYCKETPSYERLQELSRRYPDMDPSTAEPYLRIFKTGMALRNRLEHLLAGYGLTHSRFMILAALHLSTACPIAVSDLARRVGVTTPTLTSVLSGMVRDMLVRRSRDPADRRTVLVAIEQSGVDLLDQVLPVLCRRQARVMGDLTEEERRELSRLMSKVRPERLFPDQSPEQPADRADPE